jgi:hypothetical protein
MRKAHVIVSDQIITTIKRLNKEQGTPITTLCNRYDITQATYYRRIKELKTSEKANINDVIKRLRQQLKQLEALLQAA